MNVTPQCDHVEEKEERQTLYEEESIHSHIALYFMFLRNCVFLFLWVVIQENECLLIFLIHNPRYRLHLIITANRFLELSTYKPLLHELGLVF